MNQIKKLPKRVKAHFYALLKAGKTDEAWTYIRKFKKA
jgi:hypothetical protein